VRGTKYGFVNEVTRPRTDGCNTTGNCTEVLEAVVEGSTTAPRLRDEVELGWP
jgi:hypothetical protein